MFSYLIGSYSKIESRLGRGLYKLALGVLAAVFCYVAFLWPLVEIVSRGSE